jgi:hypothetical protein
MLHASECGCMCEQSAGYLKSNSVMRLAVAFQNASECGCMCEQSAGYWRRRGYCSTCACMARLLYVQQPRVWSSGQKEGVTF